ncbi:MAG: hypothetical protein PUD43_01045 [Clostridia bacterium]|nr:hypothetical protein [Clostridia bacterium]
MKGKRKYFTRSTTFDVAYLLNNSDGNVRQQKLQKNGSHSSGAKSAK